MCAIIGVFNNKDAYSIVKKGLKIMENRGKDNSAIKQFERGYLGHNLHAIVNIVKQPIEEDGKCIIANCEIYNWQELNEKYDLKAKNDAHLILRLINLKGADKLKEVLEELDGVYALCYYNPKQNKLILVRDLLGEKPIWYSLSNFFAFASEKKSLEQQGIKDIEELNPRTIVYYDTKTNKINFEQRDFFEIKPEHKKKYELLKKEVKGYLVHSISKRIPDQKVGVLFSGGVDSTIITLILKQLGVDFICYTAGLKEGNFEEPSDITYAKKVAKTYGFELKINNLSLKESESAIKEVTKLIEDNTVVKVGVGLTFYAACKLAQKDGIRVIFSGLGAEEIFAGYERHRNSSNVNNECLSGLLKIYERDLYRDDVITMNHNMELRTPFLDIDLIKYCLKIPGKYKLNKENNKLILRDISYELGLDKEFAYRKKVGAQYGSKFSRAIEKLTRQSKFQSQAEYLSQFYTKPNVKLAALISGGKDSLLATFLRKVHNYSIECFVTIKSENLSSYMYHTPNIDLVELQAKAAEIPLIIEKTKGDKEKELEALKKALEKAKEEYKIEGVVSGAIFSNYQRERIDKICDSLGLKNFSPLWHMDQELEFRTVLKNKFKVIISSIAAEGLDKSWLGRIITSKDIDNLVAINKKIGINIAFEGGEAETLVLDCPLFKSEIIVKEAKIIMEKSYIGIYKIIKAELRSKQ
jgi:diphthine-ammonia ligase